MPAYDFENLETGCIEERIMSYTKLEQFKKDNPHLRQVILSAPTTVGGVGDRVKTDGLLNGSRSFKTFATKRVQFPHT